MTELWEIYELLNKLWDVLRKYADGPLRTEGDWEELVNELEKICEGHEDAPRIARLGEQMGAAVYNYICGLEKR